MNKLSDTPSDGATVRTSVAGSERYRGRRARMSVPPSKAGKHLSVNATDRFQQP